MRIAVYGSGGVGSYFGGRLAQIGQDVVFIARDENLAALRSNGLRVGSIAGDFVIDKVQATNNPAEIDTVDYVLCCVKAWQVPAAARAIKPMVGPDTLVVPLQNGVEAPDQLIAELGRDHVLGGLCAIVAFQAGPGHIKHSGANPLIRFGHLDNHADPRVNALSEIFNHCSGVKSSIPEDMLVAMWMKFMLITPWSGLGAVSRAPIGVLLEQTETRELLVEAAEEVYRLGVARGIALPEDSVDKTMETLEGITPNSTTSMQRDLVRGQPSELDAQNGAVVRLAQQAGIDTPVNRYFLYSLRSLELRARGALSFNRRSSHR
ncbi:MAG TPA: 2-dehydropantoate 2-reductase [Gammaproteobacteria bacterium]|nr:2-dehydropantoate 2-reductase [Gammaproteobacteria bacterium]